MEPNGVMRRHEFGAQNTPPPPVAEWPVHGWWSFVAAPPGLPPRCTYIRTKAFSSPHCVIFQVRRTPTWDWLLVSPLGFHASSPIPPRTDEAGTTGYEHHVSMSDAEGRGLVLAAARMD